MFALLYTFHLYLVLLELLVVAAAARLAVRVPLLHAQTTRVRVPALRLVGHLVKYAREIDCSSDFTTEAADASRRVVWQPLDCFLAS